MSAALDGGQLGVAWGLPFAGMLLSIAILPLAAPKLWHHHFGKITAGWARSERGSHSEPASAAEPARNVRRESTCTGIDRSPSAESVLRNRLNKLLTRVLRAWGLHPWSQQY